MSILEPVVYDSHVREARVARANQDEQPPRSVADDELLRRFVALRDESAFAQLVARHAGLVMGVCRRALGNEQDAEDAFQATFLVLARKAVSVRRASSLPAWLYRTAHRIAIRARARRAHRKEQPLEAANMVATESFSHIANEHEQAMLDEELNLLPGKYRLPLFLCCIEGQSREMAAQRLGLSAGSLKGRLERGRRLLRRRLILRGVSLTVALGALAGLQQTAYAAQAIAPALIASTVQASLRYAAGRGAPGFVSPNVVSLANGCLPIMSLTTTKLIAGCLLAFGALVLVGNWLPAPAIADGEPGQIVAVMAQPEGAVDADTPVVLADGQPKKPRRSAEGDAGTRRSAEGDAKPRRSAEGDAKPRRSAEGDAGPRRSAEGDAGPRRSAEGDPKPRRSAEGDAGPLKGFKPQTRREAVLLQMIQQLQRELATLRRDVQSRAPRDGDSAVRRSDAQPRNLPAGWARTKAGGVFRAYDKNGDASVSLEEWLAMTNGNINAQRRELQTQRFREAGAGSDNKLSPVEFDAWWNGRAGAARRPRDGERGKTGPRDGDRGKTGLRDGEGGKTGPRDGEGGKTGPRDGERGKTGPRDGDEGAKPASRDQ